MTTIAQTLMFVILESARTLATKNLVEEMPTVKHPAIVLFASATMVILEMLQENANYVSLSFSK